MGRWAWTTMEGKTRSITIVKLDVPGDQTKTGITTTYAQQYKQLQLTNPKHLPKVIKTYYQDLDGFITKLDTSIILMGGFNEDPTGKNILDFQTKHNLRDIYKVKHPAQPLHTHQMGTTHIDYFLVSAPLIPQVMKIGFEALNAGIHSDLHGMYLDLSREALQEIVVARQQKLRADHSTHVLPYQEKLNNYIKGKIIVKRLQILEQHLATHCWTHGDHKELISVDKDVTKRMLRLENKS